LQLIINNFEGNGNVLKGEEAYEESSLDIKDLTTLEL